MSRKAGSENPIVDPLNIAVMFAEKQTDTEHKYNHVALGVLPAWCTLKNGHIMHMQAIEATANESNKPNKTIKG